MMSFLIDANPLVYSITGGDRRRSCMRLIQAVAGGEAEGRCSVAIMEEIWHLELSGRVAQLAGETQTFKRIFSPLLPVTDEIFARALTIEADALGANDRIHAATCLEHGIGTIVTADAGFDSFGEVERIDPADSDSVDALLARERSAH